MGSSASRPDVEWSSIEELLPRLSPGDIVLFDRGTYSHAGVYIERTPDYTHALVHHVGIDGSDMRHKSGATSEHLLTLNLRSLTAGCAAEVRCEDICIVADTRPCCIFNLIGHTPLPPQEIVARALASVGSRDYHAYLRNCQHFTTWCRYGVAVSPEAETVRNALATAAALTALLALTPSRRPRPQ